jgi:ribosome maturation factor RimP
VYSNMSTYIEKLWSRVGELAASQGLEIFDIETPSGFVRIFITRENSTTAGIADCTRLSKQILDLPDVEELLPGECQLEVSSPGVNRKLSRSEHFNRAVGERLRLVVKKDSSNSEDKEVLRGQLLSFDGERLEIEEESKKVKQLIEFNKVAEARVDFNFNN